MLDEGAARTLLEQALAERAETQAAVVRAKEADDAARRRVYSVIRKVTRWKINPDAPLRQVDVVRATGWTRTHIANIVEGKQG